MQIGARILSHVAGAVIAAMVFAVTALFIYDATVPVVTYRAETVLNPQVAPGGTLYVKYDVTRYRHCQATVYQWIFDARNIQYPVAPFVVQDRPLGDDTVTLAVPVPKEATPGPARFQLVVQHDCDLLGIIPREQRATRSYLPFIID